MTQPEGSPEAQTLIPNESSSKWYLHHLDAHITASKQQILGQATILNPNKRIPYPTIVPPSNALWTPEEKTAFFASLRRHSRYRPDLISLEVGTKTEDEVECYLDLLEYGAEITGQVDHNRRHESADPKNKIRYDGLRSWRRGLAPSAREVSDSWIEKEEYLAERIIKDIQQREEDELGIITRRNRRAERRNLLENLKPGNGQDLEKLTPYRREKMLENYPAYKTMENKWATDDYLRDIDGIKLSELNNLMKPDWSTWYSDRVKYVSSPPKKAKDPKAGDDEVNDVDTGVEQQNDAEETRIPTKGGPQGKIEMDQQNYLEIISIPKKERTIQQRKLLTAITNRRRNREKYRNQKLMEEGMTKDQIDLAGGADAIFASRENGEKSPLAPQRPRKKQKTESSAVAVGRLRQMGMYDHLMMSGVEVFNFDMIRKLYKQQYPDRPSHVSFTVLQGIQRLLVDQLRQLIHHSIILAEQAYLQHSGSQEDEVIPELTANHVYQALIKEGLTYPSEIIIDFIQRVFNDDTDTGQVEQDDNDQSSDSVDGNDKDSGNMHLVEEGKVDLKDADFDFETVSMRRLRDRRSLYPPGDIPWHHLAHLPTTTNESTEGIDSDIERDDLSETATELEELDLDDALDKLDTAHDKIYERTLSAAMERYQTQKDGQDRAEIWTMEFDIDKSDATKTKTKGRSSQDIAEKEYIEVLLATDVQRRKRKYVEYVQRRYPTTRIKKMARVNQRMKSNAWIIESDSDSDSDGEGYVWNPNEEEREGWDSDLPDSDPGSDMGSEQEQEEEQGSEGKQRDSHVEEEEDELEDEKGDEEGQSGSGSAEFETEKGDQGEDDYEEWD
ncbi:uncharacterized protein I303_106833 [Kwoniella dejecticola CBS 10117]|uniref:Uncharacterized protein n=1 Tax=Kwoniella dejecticola CBS 10117 TaxID=1296121 RepID=A0A1A5ZTJ1_9TREE|nr:uncharacterized protein I303_08525 [Kwoniella dejecticola CBS 10117]OBR81141.1 hypothetical protein I303_08525 [Kwoniella dejecticola CBS 10117]